MQWSIFRKTQLACAHALALFCTSSCKDHTWCLRAHKHKRRKGRDEEGSDYFPFFLLHRWFSRTPLTLGPPLSVHPDDSLTERVNFSCISRTGKVDGLNHSRSCLHFRMKQDESWIVTHLGEASFKTERQRTQGHLWAAPSCVAASETCKPSPRTSSSTGLLPLK